MPSLHYTLSTKPFLTSAQNPVLDVDGKALQAGVDYYAVPPSGSNTGGGGLGLQSRSAGNVTCPFDVIQVLDKASNGLPLKFSPVKPADKTVTLGTDLNVEFSASTICASSTVWSLRNNGSGSNQYFVTTGGVKGNPGRQTLSNWFEIQKFEDGYMFSYCPGVCSICRPVCGNIGVIVDNGRRFLGLSKQPLKVVFKKA